MKIAVVGSYGVGLSMFAERFPEAGETLSGGRFMSSHGGKGSNQAVAAARLGADVAFLTAVGSDIYGEEARRLWAEESVDASSVKVVDAPTMVGVIIVDAGGENRIIIAPGALEHLGPADVNDFRGTISGSDLVVVSLEIPLETAMAALRIGKEEGVATLLNPAPASPLPDDAWEWIDFVTPNASEGPVVAGVDSGLAPDDLAQMINERTGAAVVLTLGSEGAMLCDGSQPVAIPAVRVDDVVDTTGAGDAFTGALGVGLASGIGLEAAARLAVSAGAFTVRTEGVIPALPYASDLDP